MKSVPTSGFSTELRAKNEERVICNFRWCRSFYEMVGSYHSRNSGWDCTRAITSHIRSSNRKAGLSEISAGIRIHV